MVRPIELAAEAKCDLKTARRWLRPEERSRMKPVVRERVAEAARRLGLRDNDPQPTKDQAA
jgi:hypothetical protein